ncbi:MAG TPA: hypothetical protein VKW04_18170 [Planctomycetota bacterium]|nr:hypothetical protein [Planctomycetota bacterium]
MCNSFELQKLGLKLHAALDLVGSSIDLVEARVSGKDVEEEVPERGPREASEHAPGAGARRPELHQVQLGRDLAGLGAAELVALEEKAERPLTPPRNYKVAVAPCN